MNLKLIDVAMAAYEDKLEEQDRARLAFFRALWGLEAASAEALSASSYEPPASREVREGAAAGKPVFALAPAAIDEEALADLTAQLVATASEQGGFPESLCAALARVSWPRVIRASRPEQAGSAPGEWLEYLAEVLVDDGLAAPAAHLGALIASMALRVQLEEPARYAKKALADASLADAHTLLCPVCGSAPMMSHVTGGSPTAGRGRLLVCGQCGTAWEFERVRCARCGQRDQQKLHFYHIEGDDAHRIATCDECGGYIRTLYSEDSLAPCSYEVEDVVMARLDAVALEPQLARGQQSSD